MDSKVLNAVKESNLKKLKTLVDQAAVKINAQDDNGQTLLHHATIKGHCEVIEYLLQNGIDPLITNKNTYTALHIAVSESDNDDVVNAILENVTQDKLRKLLNAKTKNDDGYAAIHIAAEHNLIDNACLLLAYGANFELRTNTRKKPVDLTPEGELRKLLQLIDTTFTKAKKSDMELVDDLKHSDLPFTSRLAPLLNCKNNDNQTLMQLLFQRAPHVLALYMFLWRSTHPTDCEVTALYKSHRQNEVDKLAELAVECIECYEKSEALIYKPQKLSHQLPAAVKVGCCVLEKMHKVMLAYRRFEEKKSEMLSSFKMRTLEELIELLGFDPLRLHNSYYEKLSNKYKHDLVALMELLKVIKITIDHFLSWINLIRCFSAVRRGDADRVKQLLNTGLSVEIVDGRGLSLLCYAVERGYKKIVKLLLKAGAKLTYEPDLPSDEMEVDNRWKYSLNVAVSKGHKKVVDMLLKNTDPKDIKEIIDGPKTLKKTPLQIAAKNDQLDMMKTLLRYGATCCNLERSSEKVNEFMKIVDESFQDAKDAKVELVHKLKAMETDDFMAVVGARNQGGETLADVAAKAGAKNIAGMIFRMIRETNQNQK